MAGDHVALVLRSLKLLREGCSLNEAAKQMGEPVATLHRLLNLFRRGGLLALIPQASTGRRSVVARLALTPAEISGIASMATPGRGVQGACRAFAAKPGTRRELAQYLAAHRTPAKLRAAIISAKKRGGGK